MSNETLIAALETILTELRIRHAETANAPVPAVIVSHYDLMAVLIAHTARYDSMDQEIADLRRFILNPAPRAERTERPESA